MGSPIASMTAAASHPPCMMKMKVHSGGDYEFDDSRDFEFLKLLGDEIKDDHVMVITEGLQIQKSLASSFQVVVVADTDMTDVSDEKPSSATATVVGMGSGFVQYDDEDEGDSDSKLGIVSGEIGENIDASKATSSALFPDSAAAAAEEAEEIYSGKSATTAEDIPNSFVNAVFDDFTPKDQIWTFCELCGVVQDNQRILIKVQGCGHSFCNYCFEWHSASQLGPDEESLSEMMIKCPVESCFNEIHYDFCVGLLLQHSLDNASKAAAIQASSNISDNWEFLDEDLT